MKLNCIIIDDEPLARKILKEYIDEIDFLELRASVENPVDAYKYLTGDKIDLMFLDIEMPKISGVELLRTNKNLPPVIITTAFPDHAVESYQLDVIDYLLKPVTLERFLKAAYKAKDFIELTANRKVMNAASPSFIFVKVNNKLEKLFVQDIYFVEGQSNYVMIYTKDLKLLTYSSLSAIIQNLPSEEFIQIHKSYIIALSKIDKLDNSSVDINGHVLPIGKTYKENTNKIIQGKILKG